MGMKFWAKTDPEIKQALRTYWNTCEELRETPRNDPQHAAIAARVERLKKQLPWILR
jgi:hypothetical protein